MVTGDDKLVNAKAHKALDAGMTPIVCVGEGLEVRQAGLNEAFNELTKEAA